MYEALLQRLGLSENEAKIYDMLLFRGESKASDLVPESGLKRANVYSLLTTLVAKGLVTMITGKQQLYRAAEPTKFLHLLENKRQETSRLEAELKNQLPKLTSTFHLTTGRPTIQVFEGVEGFAEALSDSLNYSGEILTYIDDNALVGDLADVAHRYYKQRIKKGIAKRIIVTDTPALRSSFADYHNQLTQVAFLKNFPADFKTATEIYADKISHLSLDPKRLISVIIEDANMAQFHRQQFEYLWSIAKR